MLKKFYGTDKLNGLSESASLNDFEKNAASRESRLTTQNNLSGGGGLEKTSGADGATLR